MNTQNAIAQIEAGLSLEENWRDYDAEKEALAVLSALAESTQFAAYEDVRGRLVDALKERDALKAELTALRSEADAARPLIQQVEDTIDAYGKDPVLGEAVASLDDALDAYREGKAK